MYTMHYCILLFVFLGRYINTDKNGGIIVGSGEPERATRWEY